MSEQGQSAATEAKVRGIGELIRINLRIFSHVNARYGGRYRYFHFDLHAGSGWNHEVNVIGSPLAFLSAADAIGEPYLAVFVEQDESRAMELAKKTADVESAFVKYGDNVSLCAEIPDIIRQFGENPRYAMGSVLIDPNGPSGGIPWERLSILFRQCPALDVIVNYPATGMKRDAGQARRAGRMSPHFVSIDELPQRLGKEHWIIRPPQGAWQWTLTIGRNMGVNDYTKKGWVHWDSEHGREIRWRVSTTASEQESERRLVQCELAIG